MYSITISLSWQQGLLTLDHQPQANVDCAQSVLLFAYVLFGENDAMFQLICVPNFIVIPLYVAVCVAENHHHVSISYSENL